MKSEKQLYQWDVNQYLTELQPEAQFVDYPMGNEVIRIETDGKRCRIPDEFLQTAGFKTCYERYSDGTYKAYNFNVQSSPKPPDYVYTAEERTTFDALVAKADAAIAEIKRRADSGEFTPKKGVDYFTDEEKNELMESVSTGAVGEFRKVVDTATTEYNDNHNLQLAKYNANASEKLTIYDTNDEQRTSDYNRNAEQKMEAYNQNATTKTAEFDANAAALQTEVDRLQGKCDNLAAENRKQENRISALMKLNKGQTYDILPEEGEAASRTAPSGSKYVSVDKVGGKSIVWNQLLDYTKAPKTTTDNGITYQNNMDGTFTATGTANDNHYSYIGIPVNVVANHTYLSLSTQPGSAGKSYLTGEVINKNAYDRGDGAIASAKATGTAYLVAQYYEAGQTVSGEIAKPQLYDLTQMFGAGNEPTIEQFKKLFDTKIYPYNSGEIISGTTANIELNPGNIYPGTAPVRYYPCKIAKGETFTASATCGQSDVKCRFASEDGSQKDYFSLSTGVGGYSGRYKRVISAQFDIALVMFDVVAGKEASGFVVEMGEGDGTYKKYFEPSQLPTSFPELNSAGNAHDYIDMDGGKVHRKIKSVRIDGNTQIYAVSPIEHGCSRTLFMPELSPGIVVQTDNGIPTNIICDKLATITHDDYWSSTFNSSGISAYPGYNSISMRLQGRTDLDTKDKVSAWLAENPMTVCYEAEPEEVTDVTIPEALQEWLPVEAGGTVAFRNSDESKQLPVPNAVSWVRKLDEVE